MSTRVARVVRGLLVAVVALTVAAVAHLATGGRIGSVGFVLAFAFSALASIALAGRTVSRTRVSIAVLFSQGVFHLLFGIGAGYQLSPQGHQVGMVMGDPAAATVAATVSASPVMMTDDGWMWAAHGLAAVLTIAALVKGEKTFWEIAGWVAHSIARAFMPRVHPSAQHPVSPAAVTTTLAPGARFILAAVRRRGPPQAAAPI